jgi:alpha-beta hydrolase superfamily lysophospholipase
MPYQPRYAFLLLLVTCLAACTAAPMPLGKHPAPPQLLQQPLFRASDGTDLVMTHWQAQGKPRATLILLHGFNEYAGAFDSVGKQFAQRGIDVWAIDQRGFGRSAYRGLWAGTARMAADARELATLLRQQNPRQPLYLWGMSMGGAVTLVAAGNGKLPVDGIILEAPAVWTRDTQPLYQRAAQDMAVKLIPGWRPTGESLGKHATDNRALLREIWQSPWMLRGARIETVAGLVDLMDNSYQAAAGINVPTLLLYGDKDELIPAKPIERLWARLPKQGKTRFIRYPNGWHMLTRDLQSAKVVDDITQWLQAR